MKAIDPRIQATVSSWPEDRQVEFEERAAIIEFDGGCSRSAAEFRAVIEIAELVAQQRLRERLT